MGCFYIESPGMRSLMTKLRVEDFEMLTAASSMIRPGPSDSGMTKAFIKRHNGQEPVRYLHPKMEKILGETYGVMIYQEDVMRVADEVAGLSLGAVDQMRRSMTRMRSHGHILRLKEQFIKGAKKRKVQQSVAEEIWRQIASFAGYAFCKSHSASFAQVSIQSAHIKAHYPAEFMAAVLTNNGGFYSAGAYIQESRRLGLRILPPFVNKALVGYQGAKDALMVGLMAVKNLSKGTAERIIERRPYVNLADFLARVRPAKDEAESLVACGALDRFGFARPQLMWMIQNTRRKEDTGLLNGMEPQELEAPNVPDYSREERLFREMEALDFTITAHPLELYKNGNGKEKIVPASKFKYYRAKMITAVGWLVYRKRTRTHQGNYMMFLSMEDLSSTFEAVLFPQAYHRFGSALRGPGPYQLFGKVVDEFGTFSLDVQGIQNSE